MALVVEDGTGLSTAEAYISVADADTYHTAYTGSSDWSGATDSVKERVLRRGAQVMDNTYILRWKGDRTNRTQTLDWPRTSVEDTDGFIIDSNVVPVEVQRANAEYALREITEANGIIPDVTDNGTIKSEMVKVGPLERDVEYQGGKAPLTQFTVVEILLKGLLESSTLIERS